MKQATQNDLELVRVAAERGVAEAQLIYGQMLLDGRLVERNAAAAFHWFERAAKGGNLMAVNMVGRCLDQGWGVAPSAALAEPWFRKAAERGLDWGMYNLATLLILGNGVPQDKVEALLWLRKAADLNHAKSINLLGGFYEDGWIVQKDMTVAKQHYLASADGGDFRGQFNYARMLVMEGDTTGALHWLRMVPQTATPAFVSKMKSFLSDLPWQELRSFAATLPDVQSA